MKKVNEIISQEEVKILKSFAERIPPDDPDAHNNLAIMYYNKGLYDEAIQALEEALKIDPKFILARNNLDMILKKTGRLEKKTEQLARTIDRKPYDEIQILELADAYRELKRYSQAIMLYRKVLDSNPGSLEAHYGLGLTLKLLGKYDDALAEIKAALAIKKTPSLYTTLGEIYLHKGVMDLAIRNLRESIALDPSMAEGHFLLAFALSEKGKIQESLKSVKKAITLNPALAQFEPNLAVDIKEHKDHWEAVKTKFDALKISENEFQVHYDLGIAYCNKGLFDEAKKEFDECLKIQKDKPELYLVLGETSLFLNKFDDALQYLEKAYESDTDSVKCTNALGVVHCVQGNLNKAAESFRKAIALQDDFLPALNNLGVCEFNQGNAEEALAYYQKATDAGDVAARFNLGKYYLKKGEYDNALKSFDGNTADEHFGRGLVYTELGKDDAALESLKKTLSIAPDHAGAYYSLGFIMTKQGKYKEGLDLIRKGIEKEPNYEKEKFLLSLGPEFPGFNFRYGAGSVQRERFDTSELRVHDVHSAESYIVNAENYIERHEFERALNMIDHALKLEPELSKAVILKAEVLFETGNTHDAVNYLTRHTANHPHDEEVKATLGNMLQKTGQLSKAKVVYSGLLESDKDNLQWLMKFAEISYSMDDLDEALSSYTRVYDMDNENIAANLGLLRIHIRNRDFEKARPYMDFLEKKQPVLYDFNILAGIYYSQRNKSEEAIPHFEKAIELDSSLPHPYYHLGLLQVQEGHFEAACENWKKALLIGPDEKMAQKIRQCLKMTVEFSEFIEKER